MKIRFWAVIMCLSVAFSACGKHLTDDAVTTGEYVKNESLYETLDTITTTVKVGIPFDGYYENGFFFMDNYGGISVESIDILSMTNVQYDATSKFEIGTYEYYYFALAICDEILDETDMREIPEVISFCIDKKEESSNEIKIYYSNRYHALWFNDMYMIGNAVYVACDNYMGSLVAMSLSDNNLVECGEIIDVAQSLLSDEQKNLISNMSCPISTVRAVGLFCEKNVFEVAFYNDPEYEVSNGPIIFVLLTYDDEKNEYYVYEK